MNLHLGYKQAINDIRSGNGKFYGIGSGQAQVKPSDGAQIAEGNLDLNTDRRIALYLPKAIQIQDTVVYDNAFQLGLIGGAIEAGLQPGRRWCNWSCCRCCCRRISRCY